MRFRSSSLPSALPVRNVMTTESLISDSLSDLNNRAQAQGNCASEGEVTREEICQSLGWSAADVLAAFLKSGGDVMDSMEESQNCQAANTARCTLPPNEMSSVSLQDFFASGHNPAPSLRLPIYMEHAGAHDAYYATQYMGAGRTSELPTAASQMQGSYPASNSTFVQYGHTGMLVPNPPAGHMLDGRSTVLCSGASQGTETYQNAAAHVPFSAISTFSKQEASTVTIRNAPTATTQRTSSQFRGVSRHRWTKKWEAHLWDPDALRIKKNPTIKGRSKGKQVYLGAYQTEQDAAHAFDKAAIAYWGLESTLLNFTKEHYAHELPTLMNMGRSEMVQELRRRSSGFSRGKSKYRGVTKHHQQGKWEARIGRHNDSRYQYLGTYSSEEEAAKAYDYAALKTRGLTALTNHAIDNYLDPDTRLLRANTKLDAILSNSVVALAPAPTAPGRTRSTARKGTSKVSRQSTRNARLASESAEAADDLIENAPMLGEIPAMVSHCEATMEGTSSTISDTCNNREESKVAEGVEGSLEGYGALGDITKFDAF